MAGSSLSTAQHYTYATLLARWKVMRDALSDEQAVKDKGTEYLSATSGMQEDGMATGQPGKLAYDAYKKRAVWHDVVPETVEGLLGMMHREGPTIELPESMEGLRERATKTNESLDELLKRINRQQIEVGRVGILADIEDNALAGTLPFMALYSAESITNWNEFDFDNRNALDFLILDESRQVVNKADYSWEAQGRYKLLFINDAGNYAVKTEVDGTFRVREGATEAEVEPSLTGTKLKEIPFTFANVNDIVADGQRPALIGLANLAFAIYRGEADYRQSLFMQGQDTLVTIGGIIEGQIADGVEGAEQLAAQPETRTGAGSVISIGDPSGDAKYIGVESKGLEEQRAAIENDLSRASSKGAKLADSASKESGESLKIRVASRGYTITNIALAGAAALENSLKQIARWMGADESKVIVTPNLDFFDDSFGGADLKALMEGKLLGAPIALRTIHRIMREKDLTEFDYEEELDAMGEEDEGIKPPRDKE